MEAVGAVDDGGLTSVIIRTPDQKVKDLEIECEPHWTVANLKQQLSQLYPGNPTKDKQRLILAGKLLQDKTELEELFKMYEYKPIVHFVCTQSMPEPVREVESTTTSTPRPSVRSSTNPIMEPNAGAVRQALQIPAGNPRWSAHMSQLQMWHQQLEANQTHQQQHLTQALLRRSTEPPAEQAAQPPAEPPQQPLVQPQNPQPAGEQHDLLDVFYLIIRSIFLLALAWNYASPAKFCFMGVMLFYLYLYQSGYITLPNVFTSGQEEAVDIDAEARQLSPFTVFRNVLFSFFSSLLPSNENLA